ncbi:hypothetical protein FQN49_008170, partial [Arthroderma sp. PD_2]
MVFEEGLFPLVEMPSPQLCADRLDYALRDAVSFGKLAMEDARRVVGSLKAFPSATAARRLLVLDDAHVALILSRAYITTDGDVWSSPAHIDMCQRTGRVIGELVEAGSVDDKVLWQVSDTEFWTLLRQAANPEQLRAIERLEEEGIPDDNGLRLPHCAKIRTLDPDIWQGEEQPAPLSIVLPTWGSERQQRRVYSLNGWQHGASRKVDEYELLVLHVANSGRKAVTALSRTETVIPNELGVDTLADTAIPRGPSQDRTQLTDTGSKPDVCLMSVVGNTWVTTLENNIPSPIPPHGPVIAAGGERQTFNEISLGSCGLNGVSPQALFSMHKRVRRPPASMMPVREASIVNGQLQLQVIHVMIYCLLATFHCSVSPQASRKKSLAANMWDAHSAQLSQPRHRYDDRSRLPYFTAQTLSDNAKKYPQRGELTVHPSLEFRSGCMDAWMSSVYEHILSQASAYYGLVACQGRHCLDGDLVLPSAYSVPLNWAASRFVDQTCVHVPENNAKKLLSVVDYAPPNSPAQRLNMPHKSVAEIDPPNGTPPSLTDENTPSTLQPSTEVRKVSRLILDIIFEYALNKFDDSKDRLEAGASNFLSVIDRYVAAGTRVEACLPAFPFKSANKVYKVLGALPDMAEELALDRLNTMCTRIREVYSPGAQVTIISDGITYNDLLSISDQDTWAYGEALRKMAIQKKFNYIGFSRMKDLLDFPLPEKLTEITYVANCTTFRRLLINRYGSDDLDIDHEI